MPDITLRGRVLLQAAPHPDPPYLGRCSLSFLLPPEIDFVLRPMRAFDVMEVPLLHRQLHATFQSALCAPLLWPQQALSAIIAIAACPFCYAAPKDGSHP